MKNGTVKRTLSLLLALVMVIGLCPAAFAEEEAEEQIIASAEPAAVEEVPAEPAEEPAKEPDGEEPEDPAGEPTEEEPAAEVYAWEGLSDEEFAAWVTCGDNDLYIKALLAAESEELAAFNARVLAIADGELKAAVEARIEEINAAEEELPEEPAEEPDGEEPEDPAEEPAEEEPAEAPYPWAELSDEELAAWITGGENDEYLKTLLGTECDELNAFYERIAAVADEEQKATLEECIAALKDCGLPYGFKGMPEGFALSDEDLAAKDRVAENGMPEQVPNMTPGVDYAEGRAIFSASTEEYALLVAEAYNAELLSFQYGVAVIAPREATVAEAFACAMDPEMNLPLVEPDYICRLNPITSPNGASTFNEDYAEAQGDAVPVRQGWESVIDGLSNPDPLLLDPSGTDRAYQWQHDIVNSYDAWGVTLGQGVTIAIVDSGINTGHSDLKASGIRSVTATYITGTYADAGITSGEDDDGHGTHVAALAAGALNNGVAGAGIAPNASILSIKVLDSNGSGYTSTIAAGVLKAAQMGADVINISIGGYFYSDLYYNKIYQAINIYGSTVVAAMGNDATNMKEYPAGYKIPGLIAVGATDQANVRAYFSNTGSWCDVSAPGSYLYSAGLGSSSAIVGAGGTSMAAPVVSGVCALYMGAYGNPGPVAMEKKIKSAVTNGVVDAAKLFTGDKTAPTVSILPTASGSALSGYKSGSTVPYNYYIDITVGNDTYQDSANYAIIYTLNGKNPSILNGETKSGSVYTGPIAVSSLGTTGKIVTIKAAQVSGMGVLGKITTYKVKVGYAAPSSVSITGPSYFISGKTVKLTAAVNPTATAKQSVVWSISAKGEGIASASISTAGALKATLQAGYDSATVTVMATTNDSSAPSSKSATITLTVKRVKPVKTVKITSAGGVNSIVTGGTLQLTASATDTAGEAVSPAYVWTSSNNKVASVSSTGKVTAVGKGTATITCTAQDGSNIKGTFKITVTQPVTGVSFTATRAVMNPGKSYTFKAGAQPSGANNKKLTWSVSDTSIASVSSTGVVKVFSSAPDGAIFYVYATAKDGSGKYASFKVTVKNTVSTVSIGMPTGYENKVLFTVDIDNTSKVENSVQLVSSVKLSNGLNALSSQYTWSSSSKKVATVDSAGRVTAVGAGTATIKCSATDGSGKSASIKITVRVPASSITVSPKSLSSNGSYYIATGKSANIAYKLGDAYGKPTVSKVKWNYILLYENYSNPGYVGVSNLSLYNEVMKDEACAALVNSALDGTSPVNSNQPPYNPADYPNAAQNKMITLSNGKLTVSSKVSNYVWYSSSSYYQVLYILCIATTTDGTDLMDYCMYYVVPPTKTLKAYDVEDWRPYTIYTTRKSNDEYTYYFDLYITSNSLYNNQFTVKSSNPDIAGVLLIDNNTIRVYAGQKTGTATITITANDGSGKKTSFKVKTVN